LEFESPVRIGREAVPMDEIFRRDLEFQGNPVGVYHGLAASHEQHNMPDGLWSNRRQDRHGDPSSVEVSV
jgi:hypothetical protein